MNELKTKFTPWPWKVRQVKEGIDTYAIDSSNDETLAVVGVSPCGWKPMKDISNAMLMSCAPEFYDNAEKNLIVLKNLRAYYETMLQEKFSEDVRLVVTGIIESFNDRIVETEDLLKKARGEQQ